MPLCGSTRVCQCALTSTSLAITGSGSGGDPYAIEMPGGGTALPYYTFANTAARDAALPTPVEGQNCWIQNLDEEHHYTGSAWKIWYKGPTTFNYTLTAAPTPPGWTNGNAVMDGRYFITNGILHCKWHYVLGNTTAFTTALWVPTFPFPAGLTASASSLRGPEGAAWLFDPNTGRIYPAIMSLDAGITTYVTLFDASGAMGINYFIAGNGGPFLWGPNAEMNGSIAVPLA